MPLDGRNLGKLTRKELDAARGRLAKMRAEEITGRLCQITRQALEDGRIVTPLSCEAIFRQTIRASLCLEGWRWRDADKEAATVVGVVLSILQAKRPTWEQGQREYVTYGGALIERTRCSNCGKKLEGDQLRFCSSLCRVSFHARLNRLRGYNDEKTAEMVAKVDL